MGNVTEEEIRLTTYDINGAVTVTNSRRSAGSLTLRIKLSNNRFINIVLARVLYRPGEQTILLLQVLSRIGLRFSATTHRGSHCRLPHALARDRPTYHSCGASS